MFGGSVYFFSQNAKFKATLAPCFNPIQGVCVSLKRTMFVDFKTKTK